MQAIITAFVLFIFHFLCAASFVGGYLVGKRKRPAKAQNEPTEEEKRAIERARKEFKNLMNYNGTPQNEIRG